MVNLERQASALSLPAMAPPNLHLPCGCLAQDYTYALTLGWLAVSESSSMLATGGSAAAAKSVAMSTYREVRRRWEWSAGATVASVGSGGVMLKWRRRRWGVGGGGGNRPSQVARAMGLRPDRTGAQGGASRCRPPYAPASPPACACRTRMCMCTSRLQIQVQTHACVSMFHLHVPSPCPCITPMPMCTRPIGACMCKRAGACARVSTCRFGGSGARSALEVRRSGAPAAGAKATSGLA